MLSPSFALTETPAAGMLALESVTWPEMDPANLTRWMSWFLTSCSPSVSGVSPRTKPRFVVTMVISPGTTEASSYSPPGPVTADNPPFHTAVTTTPGTGSLVAESTTVPWSSAKTSRRSELSSVVSSATANTSA